MQRAVCEPLHIPTNGLRTTHPAQRLHLRPFLTSPKCSPLHKWSLSSPNCSPLQKAIVRLRTNHPAQRFHNQPSLSSPKNQCVSSPITGRTAAPEKRKMLSICLSSPKTGRTSCMRLGKSTLRVYHPISLARLQCSAKEDKQYI